MEHQQQLVKVRDQLQEEEKRGYELSRLQGVLQGKEEQLAKLLVLKEELVEKKAECVELQDSLAKQALAMQRQEQDVGTLQQQHMTLSEQASQSAKEVARLEAVVESRTERVLALETEVAALNRALGDEQHSLKSQLQALAQEHDEELRRQMQKVVAAPPPLASAGCSRIFLASKLREVQPPSACPPTAVVSLQPPCPALDLILCHAESACQGHFVQIWLPW